MFKTIQQLATEHLNEIKTVEAAPQEEVARFSMDMTIRVYDRMKNDPAIIEIAEYFSRQMMLVPALPLPEVTKQSAIRGAVINCIIEWENIHQEFGEQFTSAR